MSNVRSSLTRLVAQLSSLRLATALILLLILACAIGGVVPQSSVVPDADVIYRSYGLFWYRLITRLRLDDVFGGVWFFALVSVFALNLLLCTRQRLRGSLRRAFGDIQWPASLGEPMRSVDLPQDSQPQRPEHVARELLRKAGYRSVHRHGESNGRIQIMASRRRWGALGADVVHLGILVILLGALLGIFRQEGSFRVNAWQTGVRISRSNDASSGSDILPYDVQVDAFGVETYEGTSRIKTYWADVVLWDGERLVEQARIAVNQPLMMGGTGLYVWRYGEDAAAARVQLQVVDPTRNLVESEIELGIGETVSIPGSQAHVTLLQYDRSHRLDEGLAPSDLDDPINETPATLLEISHGAVPGEEISYRDMALPFLKERDDERQWAFLLADVQFPAAIDLRVTRNPGYPLFWWGFVCVMIGLATAFYFRPSILFVEIQERRLLLHTGGHRSDAQAQRVGEMLARFHKLNSGKEVDE